jgi:hypothetical protein
MLEIRADQFSPLNLCSLLLGFAADNKKQDQRLLAKNFSILHYIRPAEKTTTYAI